MPEYRTSAKRKDNFIGYRTTFRNYRTSLGHLIYQALGYGTSVCYSLLLIILKKSYLKNKPLFSIKNLHVFLVQSPHLNKQFFTDSSATVYFLFH
jgi:hypothetical protein